MRGWDRLALDDRLAVARDDLRRESLRTEMAFRERDRFKEVLREIVKESESAPYGRDTRMALIARAALSTEDATRPTTESKTSEGGGNREHLSSAKAAAAPDPEKRVATRPTGDKE